MSMSSINSANEAEGLSYFTATQRHSSSDSPSISPHTYPASAPARSNRRLRPPIRPHQRAKSDELSGYSQFTVQTIDENEASQNSVPLLADPETLRPPKDKTPRASVVPSDDGSSQILPSAAVSQRSSAKASVRSIIARFWPHPTRNSKQYTPTPVLLTNLSLTNLTAVHERPHSESDASRSKIKLSKRPPSRKTQSAENVARRRFRDSSESSRPTPLAPLRPPVSRKISDNSPGGHHEIKLETPFTQLRRDSPDRELRKEPPPSRRSSLRPTIVFGAPLSIFRKFRRPSATQPAPRLRSISPSTSDTHDAMLGHASQLRRTHTREALRQVSQALRLITDVLPVAPKLSSVKTFSNESTPEKRGANKKARRRTQGVPSMPARMTTQRSMELDRSASSSILNLQLGPPPNATPDEDATYKLKRSPSAETEEFLKVDISVRGGTSYLPSEARRIHTPPLPGKGAGAKRRGFFFDYNAPAETFECPAYPALRTGRKTRPVEWYDTKLAELDTTSDEGTPDRAPSSPNFVEMRQRTAHALHEMRNRNAKVLHKENERDTQEPSVAPEQEEEGGIDYSIPEHYLNSPLCPANERYWRFVDGKMGNGKHARTCWMHGTKE